MAHGQQWSALPHRTSLKYVAASTTRYDPSCSCGWFGAGGRQEAADERRKQHLADVRAIRRVATHATGELTAAMVDEIILAVFEATTHTGADRWVHAVSITLRTCFVPVPAITIYERLVTLAAAGRLEQRPTDGQTLEGLFEVEYRLATASTDQTGQQQIGAGGADDVRAAILLAFQAAYRDDRERWLVTRMIRNRTGLSVGEVRDLGVHLVALADRGVLERRPTGRTVRDHPIFAYRLAASAAALEDATVGQKHQSPEGPR